VRNVASEVERLGLLEDEIYYATDRLSRSEAKAVVHSVHNGDWLAAHDAEVAARAAEAAWQVAHEEACRLGCACSAHQPIEARANFRPWLVAVLSADVLAASQGAGESSEGER
jgi:hypothetical protein